MKNIVTLSGGPAGPAALAALLLLAVGPFPLHDPPEQPCKGTPISFIPASISSPGYYYVTTHLTGLADEDGLTINSPGVVIDLCGFTMQGVPDAKTGIISGAHGVRVLNGRVIDWPGFGIQLGENAVVTDVEVRDCGDNGIWASFGSLVERCVVVDNADTAIQLGDRSIVRDCVVEAPADVTGIALGTDSICEDVTVQAGTQGVRMDERGLLRGATVTGTTDAGILMAPYGSVEGCAVRGIHTEAFPVPNSKGIVLSGSGRVDRCTVHRCGTGVRVSEASTVTRTTVREADIGIDAGDYARVEDCTVVECAVDGIRMENGGIARGNLVARQAGAGLVAQGDRNWIEGNVADENLSGIVIEGTHNLVTENRAADNTLQDFKIPYGNPYGPVQNSGWAILASKPQANFRTPFP